MEWESLKDVMDKMTDEELKAAMAVLDVISTATKEAFVKIEYELRFKRARKEKSDDSPTGKGTDSV